MPKNVLLVVIDQFRADCINGTLAQSAHLPNLTALMHDAVSFTRHYTVTTPCGPSRASLLTGLYAMNHRSIRNGTPMSSRHETIGTQLRKAGLETLLFGYTDSSVDPGDVHPDDPRTRNYEGLATGFEEIVRLRLETPGAWTGYLKNLGYPSPDDYWEWYRPARDASTATIQDPQGSPIRSPARYSSAHSDTAWLTDRTLEAWSGMELADHLSLVTYIRPHPPLVAPAPYNTLSDPDSLPGPYRGMTLDTLKASHPFFKAYFSEPCDRQLYTGFNGDSARLSERHVAELRAVYLGLAAEVDHHVGRLIAHLKENNLYDDTLIVVTADHGEMLGDHYMWGKTAPFEPAFHIPLIIRDPRQPEQFGKRVDAFTESVDIAPTLTDWTGGPPCPAHDGRSLIPLLGGTTPANWRTHVFAEAELGEPDRPTRFQRMMDLDHPQANYALYRDDRFKYVHFNGNQPPLLFDLLHDPQEGRNLAQDPRHLQTLQKLAMKMLDHRMTHADQSLSSHKLTPDGLFTP